MFPGQKHVQGALETEKAALDSGQERPSRMLLVVVVVVETLSVMLILKAGCAFTGCTSRKSILDEDSMCKDNVCSRNCLKCSHE